MLILFAVFLYLLLAKALPIGQKPILRLSVKSHDREIVTSMLHDAYAEAYKLNTRVSDNYITNYSSMALQYTADNFCVDNTVIRYYIKSFGVKYREFPASPCALNLNSRFYTVILPEPDFHNTVHGTVDLLSAELEVKAERYILELPGFDFEFDQFDDLDYDLECNSGYRELMQVMYKEKVLTVNLQLDVSVPKHCTFSKLNPDYDNRFDKMYREIHIPISGEFFCQSGNSISCKASMANTRNFRYKLFE